MTEILDNQTSNKFIGPVKNEFQYNLWHQTQIVDIGSVKFVLSIQNKGGINYYLILSTFNQLVKISSYRILLKRGVLDKTLCDKVCHWLEAGRWFSPDTLVSSNNKTDILLRVALNTISITVSSAH